MPAFVTDDSGKQVAVDLSTTDALIIREGIATRLLKIFITGVALAGNGTIVLRKDAADGPIVFTLEANVAADTRFVIDVDFPSSGAPAGKESAVVSGKGLYLDALAVAWTSGSTMMLYFDKEKALGAFEDGFSGTS